MKRLIYTIAALALLWFGVGQARADFIVNGGFETGNFNGWTVNTDGNIGVAMAGFDGYFPHSGTYFAYLGNESGLGTLSQSISTTAGQSYTLDYFLASNGTVPNEFKTTIGGTVVSDLVNIPIQPYTEYSFTFTATGSSTLIQFGERDDPAYLALDDVSVNSVANAVPAPASIILLGVGGLGLAGYRWCRRKAAVA